MFRRKRLMFADRTVEIEIDDIMHRMVHSAEIQLGFRGFFGSGLLAFFTISPKFYDL